MILHVDLDAFFASVEQRDNPALAGKPIIVGGPSVSRGVVATASYEARKFGIHSGMPLFRARALCPQAILVSGNFAKYELASEQFAQICSDYSPTIEQISLDELYMDLTGTEQLYTAYDVAKKIQQRVQQEVGVTCSVGISAQKTLAKLASGFKKPNGITQVPKGGEKEFLEPLAVSDLPGCGRQTQKVLKDLGIHTVESLSRMPREHVEVLLGKNGLHLWLVANGADDVQVIPPSDAKSTSRSTTFSFDTNNRGFVEGMLFYLSHKVAQDLRSAKVAGRCIYLTVRTSDFVTTSMQYTVQEPVYTAREIFAKSKELLDQLWDGARELRLIGVGVTGFNQMKGQKGLFDALQSNERWQSVEAAMDNIRKKHGFLSIMPLSVFKIRGQYPVMKTAKVGN